MKAALSTALLLTVTGPATPAGEGAPAEAASALLSAHVKTPGPRWRLAPLGVTADGDRQVVRYELRAADAGGELPVLGRGAVVRLGAGAGAAALVHADLRVPAPGDLPAGPWAVSADDAAGLALAFLAKPALRAPAAVAQAVLPGDPPARVHVVDLRLRPAPLSLRILVDGDDPAGRIHDLARTDLSAGRAYVFPSNPVSSDLVEVELPWLDGDTDVLEGRYAAVYRCRLRGGQCEERNAAVADADGDYLFDPDDRGGNDRDPFSEVSAYWHVNRMRGVLGDLGMAGADLRRLKVLVNWPDLNNAAFSPQDEMLIFGQGRRDFAYDGDVVYHEYGHAVVSVTARLNPVFALGSAEFDYRPGALNEGIADQWATALTDDPRIGEYAGGYRYGGEIRNADGDAVCPLDQIGEEHHDSQPFGQAMWEVRAAVRDALGEAEGGAEYLGLAWSLLLTLLPTSGPSDADGVLRALAAERFAGQDGLIAAVEAALDRHRLPECQRYIPVDSAGPGHSAVSLSSVDLTGGQASFDMPAHLQHTVEVPAGTARLEITKRMLGCERDCDQGIHLRHGAPVAFRLGAMDAVVVTADHSFDRQDVVGVDDPAPGTWYVGNTNGSWSTFIYSIASELTPYPVVEPPPPDEAPEPDPEPGTDLEPGTEPGPGLVAEPGPEPGPDPEREPDPAPGAGGDVAEPPPGVGDNPGASGGCACSQDPGAALLPLVPPWARGAIGAALRR